MEVCCAIITRIGCVCRDITDRFDDEDKRYTHHDKRKNNIPNSRHPRLPLPQSTQPNNQHPPPTFDHTNSPGRGCTAGYFASLIFFAARCVIHNVTLLNGSKIESAIVANKE